MTSPYEPESPRAIAQRVVRVDDVDDAMPLLYGGMPLLAAVGVAATLSPTSGQKGPGPLAHLVLYPWLTAVTIVTLCALVWAVLLTRSLRRRHAAALEYVTREVAWLQGVDRHLPSLVEAQVTDAIGSSVAEIVRSWRNLDRAHPGTGVVELMVAAIRAGNPYLVYEINHRVNPRTLDGWKTDIDAYDVAPAAWASLLRSQRFSGADFRDALRHELNVA